MKSLLVLDRDDFVRGADGRQVISLLDVVPKLRKEEAAFDIVAFVDGSELTLLKNRFGPLGRYTLSPELVALLCGGL
jgi:hypothetical protein